MIHAADMSALPLVDIQYNLLTGGFEKLDSRQCLTSFQKFVDGQDWGFLFGGQ